MIIWQILREESINWLCDVKIKYVRVQRQVSVHETIQNGSGGLGVTAYNI